MIPTKPLGQKMKKHIKVIFLVLFLATIPLSLYAAATDFLILEDIGSYKYRTQSKKPLTNKTVQIPGYTMRNAPGKLAGTHFDADHDDITYETAYHSDIADLGVEVQVTKHAGGDSDKWLLHEVQETFQKARTLGALYAAPHLMKDINGNRIYFMWMHYKWISNEIVVSIDFTDFTGTKPEPLEVVKEYLQKFPSSIPPTLVLDETHKIQWIKDEIDRRLWLCDKWLYQLQHGKIQQTDALRSVIKSLNIFLDYREKYYGIKAVDEKHVLDSNLFTENKSDKAKLDTTIAKLDEYKKWWSSNKTKSIKL
jgi:hypothetical protein